MNHVAYVFVLFCWCFGAAAVWTLQGMKYITARTSLLVNILYTWVQWGLIVLAIKPGAVLTWVAMLTYVAWSGVHSYIFHRDTWNLR